MKKKAEDGKKIKVLIDKDLVGSTSHCLSVYFSIQSL